MMSTYRWQGAVSREPEQQFVIKTLRSQVAALETRLRELHPYELPEFSSSMRQTRLGRLPGLGRRECRTRASDGAKAGG